MPTPIMSIAIAIMGIMPNIFLELSNKSQIATFKRSDFIDVIFEHRQSFDAETPGKTLILVAFISACNKNPLVNHPGPADLHPASAFANRATLALTHARHIELKARFSKWEITRPKTNFQISFKKSGKKCFRNMLEIGNRDILIHD